MIPKLGNLAEGSLIASILIRVVTCVVCAALGFFLAEFAFNPWFLTNISTDFLILNYKIYLLILAVVYFLGMQSRAALGVYLAACTMIGVANHYINSFKGAPILPSDVLAAGTAADVSGGYTFTPDPTVIVSVLVLIAACAALFLVVPKLKLTPRFVLCNLLAFALVGSYAYDLLKNYDIKWNTGCKVDVWFVTDSFQAQGTMLCFLQRVQELDVTVPEGYSDDAVRDLLGTDQKGNPKDADGDADAASNAVTSPANTASKGEKAPVVLVVMNETFADLSLWDELAGQDCARTTNYYDIAEKSLLSGYTYVSAYAGGTCNSEWEFLTGMSCGNMPGGVYPYMVFSMDKTENLARYFKSQGFHTTAMHPCPPQNWRRDVVYKQFGFDDFVSEADFEGAEKLREKTTDHATYEKTLEILKQDESTPQFLFNVTYQNHSGYSSGLVPDDLLVHAKINGQENDSMNEYLSVVQVADKELKWFVKELEKLDRPVTLCLFGDHGPNLIGDLLYMDENAQGYDQLNQIQKKYTTPYLIWTNSANKSSILPQLATTDAAKASLKGTQQGFGGKIARTTSGTQTNLSLNYLGVALVESLGLPLTPYQQFLARTYETMPCVNLDGTMDAKGNWHWFEDCTEHPEWDVSQALASHRIVQHGNLHGDRKAKVGFLRETEGETDK